MHKKNDHGATGQNKLGCQFDPVAKLMMSTTKRMLRYSRHLKKDDLLQIPMNFRLELCKGLQIVSIPQRIGSPAPSLTIQTDASRRGWGIAINQTFLHGTWDMSMKYSMNALELLTIFLALLVIEKRGLVI